VSKIGEDLRAEVDRMIAIMRDGLGVGLAPPNSGSSAACSSFQPRNDAQADGADQPGGRVALRRARRRRGGLPQPAAGLDGRRAPAARARRGLDVDGEPVTIEASGLEARVLQHEIDHLDGVLILDRARATSARRAAGAARGRQLQPAARTRRAERGRPRASRATHRRVRTVYLGTSDFAATVLRRLGRLPHRPLLVVDAARPPAGQGPQDAAAAAAPAARARASSCTRPRT
jgi:peptide deformylase